MCVHWTDSEKDLLEMSTHRKQEGTEAYRAENESKDALSEDLLHCSHI